MSGLLSNQQNFLAKRREKKYIKLFERFLCFHVFFGPAGKVEKRENTITRKHDKIDLFCTLYCITQKHETTRYIGDV